MNEAHHEPQGNASYNPDKSVTNKHTFQKCSREIRTTKGRQSAYTATTTETVIF